MCPLQIHGIFIGPQEPCPGNDCSDTSDFAHNITIRDSEIDNNGGDGIRIHQCRNNLVLENLDVHDMDPGGHDPDHDGVHITNCPGFRITGGTFTGATESGIDLSRTGNIGSNCEDWNSGVCVGGASANKRCLRNSDCPGGRCQPWVIEKVRHFGNGSGSGIKITSCAYAGVIRNNFIADGLFLMKCAHGIDIYNNTMTDGLGLRNNQYGMNIRNNIILCNTSYPCVMVHRGGGPSGASIDPQGAGLTPTTWDNNLVYNRGTGPAVKVQSIASRSPYPEPGAPRCEYNTGQRPTRSYNNNEVGAWRADDIFGEHVGEGDIWNANVRFEAEASRPPDLHLAAGDASGVMDGGVSLSSEFSDDIDGQSRSTVGWDIGADEVGGAWGTPPVLLSVEVVDEP